MNGPHAELGAVVPPSYVAYIDDGVHLAYPSDLEQVLHHLDAELQVAGLSICAHKSCLLISEPPAPGLTQLGTIYGNTTRHDGLRIAGQFVSDWSDIQYCGAHGHAQLCGARAPAGRTLARAKIQRCGRALIRH
eukprot:724758-Amphidinium_carterae.2